MFVGSDLLAFKLITCSFQIDKNLISFDYLEISGTAIPFEVSSSALHSQTRPVVCQFLEPIEVTRVRLSKSFTIS